MRSGSVGTSANLIVGTTNNNAPIHMVTKKAAASLIKPGVEPAQGILNMIEMAFRAFDPCYSCATHSLPGQMPLEVRIHKAGAIYRLRNVHDTNLATALELGRRLGMRIPADREVHVFAVEIGDNLTFAERMTEALESRFPEYASEICGEVAPLLGASS